MSRQSLTHLWCVAIEGDTLRRYWKIEDHNLQQPVLSQEERPVIDHFKRSHMMRHKEGRFIILHPQKMIVTLLGDPRTQVLRRFKTLKQWL